MVFAQQGGGYPPEPNLLGTLIILGSIFFIFYFLVFRPYRKEQEQHKQLLANLKKNDRVLTRGGIIGTVVNIKDNEVTLKIDTAGNVRVVFLKAAIQQVFQKSSDAKDSDEGGSGGKGKGKKKK
ncbi:MAG: preprotein translocase subunit YajC [Planctomycetota bacterium]|nr:MAG: preprotein translocase subunit YajC [Planctomycetota bacterium]